MLLLSKQGRVLSSWPLGQAKELHHWDELVRAAEGSPGGVNLGCCPQLARACPQWGGDSPQAHKLWGQPEAQGLFPATLAHCPPLSHKETSGT